MQINTIMGYTELWRKENLHPSRTSVSTVDPFYGCKSSTRQTEGNIVRVYRETERKNMHKTLDDYLLICRQMGVQAQVVHTEMDRIEEGIVELISQHEIRKLVMDAAAEKQYKKKMMELKSTKAIFVCENAHVSCHIQFICKGNLIHTRESSAETETGKANPLRSRSVSLGQNRNINEPGLSATLTSWSEGNDLIAFSPPSCYLRSPSIVEAASSFLQPSPSTLSTCSSNGALNFVDGSLDNTLYEQYQQAEAEADKETQRRRKAGRDLVEAIHRAQEETIQRKEIAEELAKERVEVAKVKNQIDQVMEELWIAKQEKTWLKNHIVELQKERDKFQIERDSALKDADVLRRKQAEASRHMPQFFSEYLLSDIEEATHDFDESLKIGQGGYGSIYKGRLHETEVAIKRLQSQGSQGPSEFRMEVRVLSQLRHPNLVRLVGSCPEVFALIYEC